MVNITLTSSMRSNLTSLRTIASQMNRTQERLATGKKVNSAIDNASSFYQARALTNRAADLNALLNSMGQGIQTIQAATTGIETASGFLDQAGAVASQAASKAVINFGTVQDVKGYEARGYTAITSEMSTAEIQNLLTEGAKVVLADDITLTATLTFSADNITFDGNGHTISYTGNGGFTTVNNSIVASDSAIKVTGSDACISNVRIAYTNAKEQGAAVTIDGGTAAIDNLAIEASTSAGLERVYGIQVIHDGELSLDSTSRINVAGKYSHKIVNGNPDFWDGAYNTDMIVQQMGEDNIAAWATSQFYTEGTQAGDWYLPGLGELADLYGTDYSQITTPAEGHGTTGVVGDTKTKVNDTLGFLAGKGVEAAQLTNSYYWSSSEINDTQSWSLGMNNGTRSDRSKNYSFYVRSFQLLKIGSYPFTSSAEPSGAGGATATGTSVPQIGDIVYDDKSWSRATSEAYAASAASGKTAIGVVTWISEDQSEMKIVNLKDLATTGSGADAIFDPEHPYTGTQTMKWQKSAYYDAEHGYYGQVNITNIKDYYWESNPSAYAALTAGGTMTVTHEAVEILNVSMDEASAQYNRILGEYDAMIADTSYQGINLLNGGDLTVTFDENRQHSYTVIGSDATSAGLGVDAAAWESVRDIETSVAQLQNAVTSLRRFAENLGNSYQIIQTRESFTDGLTDILETGADDLVLADMNEESANYLSLQVRNNLAINALSLASQSAQSVLKLF